MLRVVKRDKKKREEEDRARAIRQKTKGGKEIIVYANAKAIDRKLLPSTSREQPGQYTSSEVHDRKCCRTNYPRNDRI